MPVPDVHVTVVGIGADGWSGLAEPARTELESAEVVVGSPRQLDLIPEVAEQIRVRWPSPLRPALPDFLEPYAARRIVVIASGDPFLSGIGTTLVAVLGADRVRAIPHVSSVALARARMGWSAESTAVVSVVGRDVHAVVRELVPGRRVLVLSSDEHSPGQIAELLVDRGYGASRMSVLADLGSPEESRYDCAAAELVDAATPARLNVVAIECAGPLHAGWVPGLPDELYENDGQLTRRDLRASALARLMPAPGQLLWDVGAGAGSVGIEWMRAHPTCRAVAIESDAGRAERVGRNARELGVPALQVITGAAPDALDGLAAPHAIFIGGGASRPGVLDTCLAALRPGGRIVVHGVTLETEAALGECYRRRGGELVRMSVEHAAPIGGFTGWTPTRTITQWSWTAPESVQ